MLIKQVVQEEKFLGCCDSKDFCPLLSLCVKSSHRLPLCSSHVATGDSMSPQSNIQFTSGGGCKVMKATNVILQSVFSTEEGDDGEEEDQRRQMRRERGWSDWSGRSSRESDWSGRSNNRFDRLPGRHGKTPSEEVVTHHLDELWHLGPGETKEGLGGKLTHYIAHTNTHIEIN